MPPNQQIPKIFPVVQESFSGGMRDRDHASLLDPNQYAYMKDGEIRDSGLCKMRSGRTVKTNQVGGYPQGGVFYRNNSGTAYLVEVNSGKTYHWNGTATSLTQLGTTIFNNTTDNVSFSILNGRLFISPGQSDNNYSWDGSAASLTDEGNTNADAPRGTLLCGQAGRLVAAGLATTQRDYLMFSDIFDGQTWDRATNNKRVPTDGSEAVTAIATYRKEEILAFTAFSTHLWNIAGSTVSSFARTQLDSKVGCIAPRSVVVIGDDAFFLSHDRHLRSIKRTVQDLAFGVTNPVTYFVPKLMSRISPTYAKLCASAYFNNYYLLAAPLNANTDNPPDTTTRNSGIIVFDMLHQFSTPSGSAPVCVGEWGNMAVNQFVVTYFSDIPRLHYVDANNGAIVQMFDGSTNDDGTLLTPQIDFRAFDLGAPNLEKVGHGGEMQFLNTSGTATLSFAKDDALFNTVASGTAGGTGATLPVFLPFFLPGDSGVTPTKYSLYRQGRSKYWQPRLSFSGSSMNLKQFTFRAKAKKFVKR